MSILKILVSHVSRLFPKQIKAKLKRVSSPLLMQSTVKWEWGRVDRGVVPWPHFSMLRSGRSESVCCTAAIVFVTLLTGDTCRWYWKFFKERRGCNCKWGIEECIVWTISESSVQLTSLYLFTISILMEIDALGTSLYTMYQSHEYICKNLNVQ